MLAGKSPRLVDSVKNFRFFDVQFNISFVNLKVYFTDSVLFLLQFVEICMEECVICLKTTVNKKHTNMSKQV